MSEGVVYEHNILDLGSFWDYIDMVSSGGICISAVGATCYTDHK